MIGIVGGKEFDPKVVADYLSGLPKGSVVVTGDGQGLERWVAEQAPELGLKIERVPLRRSLYNYMESYTTKKSVEKKREVNKALDIQVYEIFNLALYGTLVLVGNGGRVKAMRDKLKQTAWPIEVVTL